MFVHFSTLVNLTHLPKKYWSQNSYLCFMLSSLSYIIAIPIDLTTSVIISTSFTKTRNVATNDTNA